MLTGGVLDGVGTTVGGGITDIIDITSLHTIIAGTITATSMLGTIAMRMQRPITAEDIDKSIRSTKSQETISPEFQLEFWPALSQKSEERQAYLSLVDVQLIAGALS